MPLDMKEEKQFAELHDKCRKLKVMPPPAIFIGMKVEKDGEVLLDDRSRGHSWTRNWYNAALAGMTGVAATGATFGAGHISGRDTGGTVRGQANTGAGCSGWANKWNLDGLVYKAAAGSTVNGIVVGRGDTAFDADDYILETLCANGTGANQFSYGAQILPTSDYDSTGGSEAWTITHTRVLNNNSAAAIDVKEVGLVYGMDISGMFAWRFGGGPPYLDERTVLPETVTVPVGAQLTVTYEITMDFSAIDTPPST